MLSLQCKAITQIKVDLLSIRPLEVNFGEI